MLIRKTRATQTCKDSNGGGLYTLERARPLQRPYQLITRSSARGRNS